MAEKVIAVWHEWGGMAHGKVDVFWYYGNPCPNEGDFVTETCSDRSSTGFMTVHAGHPAQIERALLAGLQTQYPNALVVDEADLH